MEPAEIELFVNKAQNKIIEYGNTIADRKLNGQSVVTLVGYIQELSAAASYIEDIRNMQSGNQKYEFTSYIIHKHNLNRIPYAAFQESQFRRSTIFTQTLPGDSVDVSNLLEYIEETNLSTNPDYPAGEVGDWYTVSVSGKIGGASGVELSVNGVYYCVVNNSGGAQAVVGTSWKVLDNSIMRKADGTAVLKTNSGNLNIVNVPAANTETTVARLVRNSITRDVEIVIETYSNILYVSAGGNDATGKRGDDTRPFLTLAAAITASSIKDRIEILDGTYSFSTYIDIADGRSLIVHQSVVVTITTGGRLRATNGSLITFKGANVITLNSNGILSATLSSNIEFGSNILMYTSGTSMVYANGSCSINFGSFVYVTMSDTSGFQLFESNLTGNAYVVGTIETYIYFIGYATGVGIKGILELQGGTIGYFAISFAKIQVVELNILKDAIGYNGFKSVDIFNSKINLTNATGQYGFEIGNDAAPNPVRVTTINNCIINGVSGALFTSEQIAAQGSGILIVNNSYLGTVSDYGVINIKSQRVVAKQLAINNSFVKNAGVTAGNAHIIKCSNPSLYLFALNFALRNSTFEAGDLTSSVLYNDVADPVTVENFTYIQNCYSNVDNDWSAGGTLTPKVGALTVDADVKVFFPLT